MDGPVFPEDLSEWEQVELPSPHTIPVVHHSGASSEMEGIGHNCIQPDSSFSDVVFSPTHRQGLQIPQPVNTISQSLSSSSSLSATSSEGDDDEARDRPPWLASGLLVEIWGRLRLRFGAMSSGVLRVASKICDYKLSAGGYWAVASMTGLVTAVLVSLYARVMLRRWRPRVLYHDHHDKERMRMVLLLRERDEKISQLLLRVAELNEALTSRRRVPVLRIG